MSAIMTIYLYNVNIVNNYFHNVILANMFAMLTLIFQIVIIVGMTAFYEEFGRLVLNARTKAKMSQDALSKRVGMSRTSVTNIEKGRQQLPLHMLYSFADALGTSPSDLFPDKNKITTPTNLIQVDVSHLPKEIADVVVRLTQFK